MSADLVDCWEGAALPGGTYQVLAVQEFYTTAVVPSPLPPQPTESGNADGTDHWSSTAGRNQRRRRMQEPPLAAGDGLAADAVDYVRVVSAPVDLTVTGDVPDDPFGQYLPKPVEPIDTPDDLLTADQARLDFAAHVTSTPWAMEAGSQRVVKVNDSAVANDQTVWQQNYFGCAWDAGQSVGFPSTSANWDLLDVSATVPTSIDVSYGWVVEDNPVIDMKVTNVSGHTLPGYWGPDPNTSLVLVRDGKVVAEGYPVGATRDNKSPEQNLGGMLSPGGSVEGTYLWREVNGCFDGTTQALVGPGTYTVLNAQSIYFDAGQVYYGQPIDGIAEPAVPYRGPATQEDGASSGDAGVQGGAGISGDAGASSGASGASVGSGPAGDAIAPAPLPAPGDGWLELQVWTSLGTVTVR